jgi:hypothetical protein
MVNTVHVHHSRLQEIMENVTRYEEELVSSYRITLTKCDATVD